MIALVVSACFLADPAVCRAFRTPAPDENDVVACTTEAQRYLPQWAQEHPGWRITKWSCVTATIADL